MNKSIVKEFKLIFHLALPLILNLLAYMAMQLVDVVMLGRLGPLALASSALGNVIYIIVVVGCIGILTAVGTLAAQAFGDKDHSKVTLFAQQGLWIAFLLSIPGILLLLNAQAFLLQIKQPLPVVFGAQTFLKGLAFGFLPCLCFITLREFITAIAKPRVVMIIAIAAIPLNALLNYVLMYGMLGLPALGIYGVGLATSIVDWLMLGSLIFYINCQANIKTYQVLRLQAPNLNYLKRILKLGSPVGVSFIIEEFLFVLTTLMMGYLGVIALAAHQIAIQCLYTVVMIPVGIAQATAIRVSHSLGAGEPRVAFLTAYVAIASGLIFAFLVACLLWIFPNGVVSLFLETHQLGNHAVAVLAAKLLVITAIFHIIDATQIITNGALRGYQDTLVPMFLGLVSFWLVGIGSGYFLGFVLHLGPIGLWWGLALGIAISALLLQLRLLKHRKFID